MPAIQEFLASYAVRVDEAGLYRLQQALDQNREKAGLVQAAFTAALSSVNAFSASLNDLTFHPDLLNLPDSVPLTVIPELAKDAKLNLPESVRMKVIPEPDRGVPLSLPDTVPVKVTADLTEAEAAVSDFVSRLSALRPPISANASGITSAVSNAVSRARSLVSGLNLSIRFTPTVSEPELPEGEPVALGTGGRISKPTFARIAEEGDPEYVIPVKNEDRAVPLLRRLFSELSASAAERLFGAPAGAVPEINPVPRALPQAVPQAVLQSVPPLSPQPLPDLSALRAELSSLNLSSVTNNTVTARHEVSAPVNISVTSTGPTAEAVGKTVYNVAERALVRTLEGVFA